MNSKTIDPAAKPSKNAAAKVYEAAVVRRETKSGASSFDRRSIRRRKLWSFRQTIPRLAGDEATHVFKRVSWLLSLRAMTVTQSRSTATEMPICGAELLVQVYLIKSSGAHCREVEQHRQQGKNHEETDQGGCMPSSFKSQEAGEKYGIRGTDSSLLGDDGPADEAEARVDVDEVSDRAGEEDGCAGREEAEDGRLEGRIWE